MEADDLSARLGETLILTEEEEAPVALSLPAAAPVRSAFPLYVRVLVNKRVNEAAFIAAMKKAWSLDGSTRALKVEQETFCFILPTLLLMLRIPLGPPPLPPFLRSILTQQSILLVRLRVEV